MNNFNDELFDKIFAASNFGCKTLWAGFTIITKDLAEYICINAFSCKGIECFLSAYTATLTEDRFYLKQCSPDMFISLQDARLNHSITAQAKIANFEIEQLNEDALEDKEWLIYPGWALTKAFQKKFMEQLCESGLPFQQYEEGEINKEELVKAITVYLIDNEFTKDTFWYPFLIYLAMLIVKTGKRPFCSEGDGNCC